jgi:uncharacterized protein
MAMRGPLIPGGILDFDFGLPFAVIAGVLFGFFLERAGFANPKKLTAMFFLRDFAVLRVMFTAVVVAMLGLFVLSAGGLIELKRIAIPATYLWPQAVGGLLIGMGFLIGGY